MQNRIRNPSRSFFYAEESQIKLYIQNLCKFQLTFIVLQHKILLIILLCSYLIFPQIQTDLFMAGSIHQDKNRQFDFIIIKGEMSYCPLKVGRSQLQYNPFQHPPSLSKGVKHYKSTLVGQNIISSDSHLCECCCRVINKNLLDLNCNYSDLGFLSVSIAIYFQLIKLVLMLLLIVLLPVLPFCFLDLEAGKAWSLFEVIFVERQELVRYLILLQIILSGVAIYFINQNCATSVELIERSAPLPEQYALKLMHLPPCSEEQLRIWIQNKFGEYPCTVILAYDTKGLNESFRKREELTIHLNRLLLQKHHHHNHGQNSLHSELIELKDRKKLKLREQIDREDQILNKVNLSFTIPQQIFVGVAFVILQRAEKCREILKQNEQTLLQRVCVWMRKRTRPKYRQSQILIRRAPNPKDIIWANLKPGLYKTLLTYSILFVAVNWFLGPTFINVILFFNRIWPNALLLLCLFFYFLYQLSVHLFVSYFLGRIQCSTYTRRALISFYSYGILNLIFPAAMPYRLGLAQPKTVEFTYLLLFVDSLTHSAIKIFNFSIIYNKMYCEYINHLPPNSNPYTQNYFNRLMEGWQFKIDGNYHYLWRGLCLCAFFARSAPLPAGFYLFVFGIEFWVNKYILLRKCKTPPKVSQALSDHFLSLLHFLPLAFALGAYSYDTHFQKQSPSIAPWSISLTFVYCACLLFLRYFKLQKEPCKRLYKQMQPQFSDFYEVQNEINKYNWQLRHKSKSLILRQTSQEHLYPIDFFIEEQELESEQLAEKKHRSLVSRLTSYNMEMSTFHTLTSFPTFTSR